MSVWDTWDTFSYSPHAHMCMAVIQETRPTCPFPRSRHLFHPTIQQETMTDSHSPAIDIARSALLDNGHTAVVCITPTGAETYWLLAPDDVDDPTGCACRHCAPHEWPAPSKSQEAHL